MEVQEKENEVVGTTAALEAQRNATTNYGNTEKENEVVGTTAVLEEQRNATTNYGNT